MRPPPPAPLSGVGATTSTLGCGLLHNPACHPRRQVAPRDRQGTAGSPATALVVRETRTYGRGNCGTTQRRALETGSERPAPSQTRQLHELPCHPPKAGRTTRTANRKRPRRRRVVETQPLPTSTSPASIQPISALPPPPAIDGALRKSESSRHFVTNRNPLQAEDCRIKIAGFV